MSQQLYQIAKYLMLGLGIGICLAPCFVFAQVKDSKKMAISYVVYPQIERYIDLISDIYTELGYEVTIIPTPATRGLVLLNDGEVDADVVRVAKTVQNYPNALLVEPALKIGKLVLICVKDVLCERSVLQDKKAVILSTEGIQLFLTEPHISARIKNIQALTYSIDMLKAGRANYAILLIDGSIDFTQDFNLLTLQEMAIHHVMHKKHADLLPLVQQKLIEKLPAFNAQIEEKNLSSEQ
ncbi:hypothetical protein [Paraglaciecola hydrolytica]|uniref:Solute-binding protein family 3/N-terminal domain-containing protein n=1 Tax=Paraglaciecola hydrolytica TaxID=1799789 RepID=A0A148KMC2_9ALTE|nr:hypothetical protein [Paraglaciecola hydrolytica]KXI27473.1 hypothetical protein AX660_22450 [Paraglaciecola hydrolytica]